MAARLTTADWLARERAHVGRLEKWTEPRRRRRARNQRHPVHDFLFDYYRYSMAKLLEWHPAAGVSIEDSTEARERFQPPTYVHSIRGWSQDPYQLKPKERKRLRWTLELLRRTASRPAWLECFGVHEWAMVYRTAPARHKGALPLRVSQSQIDRLVESRSIVCTHFDAYRFFAHQAQPLNRIRPTLEARTDLEQPGCIHANMDLYKWAYKSMPWIGSDLLADCFELAVELREVDMRASPYDVTSLGLPPIPVESDAGRDQYVELQRHLADRAGHLRGVLISALEAVCEMGPAESDEATSTPASYHGAPGHTGDTALHSTRRGP